MSDSDNLSKRLIIRGKDLTKSVTGLSALLIFLTLLTLGIVFQLRLEPPIYNIQEATFVDADVQPSSIPDPSTQPEIPLGAFDTIINEIDKNSEAEKAHALELDQLSKSKEQENDSSMINNESYNVINDQMEEREVMIAQEEALVDDLLEKIENGKLPESITNGHTQALIQETSLEKSIEEYEQSLISDEDLSEEAKNQIRNALLKTTSEFNEERENRRDSLKDAKTQFSNEDLSTTAQEDLVTRMEKEAKEYAEELKQHELELQAMLDEEVTDENAIKDFSNEYQQEKDKSKILAKAIDELHDELEKEEGILIKPDSTIEKLIAKDSDRSSIEEEINDSTINMINELSEDISKEEKERLIAKNNKEKSQRRNLNNKKQILLDQISSSDKFDKEPMVSSAGNLVDKIDNVGQGLDLANQKIDLILDILSTNNPSEVAKDLNSQLNQDRRKNNDQEDETEESEIIDQFIFNTFDQINSENKDLLEKQIEFEKEEFDNFSGAETLSEAFKKKDEFFRGRLTYRPDPIYPLRAREEGISGSCVASYLINSDGQTEDISVNCTDEVFKSNTISAIKRFVFEPDDYISPKLIVYFRLKAR